MNHLPQSSVDVYPYSTYHSHQQMCVWYLTYHNHQQMSALCITCHNHQQGCVPYTAFYNQPDVCLMPHLGRSSVDLSCDSFTTIINRCVPSVPCCCSMWTAGAAEPSYLFLVCSPRAGNTGESRGKRTTWSQCPSVSSNTFWKRHVTFFGLTVLIHMTRTWLV